MIYARQLKEKIEIILNVKLSESTLQRYRKKVSGFNYRRSRFAPKIYTQDEKDKRLVFAQNLKRSLEQNPDLIKNLLLSDESQCLTDCLGFYHHRRPSNRPSVAGATLRFKKGVNLWAGITSSGPTKPVVSY